MSITEQDYLKAKEIVKTYEEQLQIAEAYFKSKCYDELKNFLIEKRQSKRLCAWDSVKHEEIWCKMYDLELKNKHLKKSFIKSNTCQLCDKKYVTDEEGTWTYCNTCKNEWSK